MTPVTRRLFVRTAALAGAGGALHGCAAFRPGKVHDVVVLGAGIAGLTAGRALARAAPS